MTAAARLYRIRPGLHRVPPGFRLHVPGALLFDDDCGTVVVDAKAAAPSDPMDLVVDATPADRVHRSPG
jgi:hypothetical protein